MNTTKELGTGCWIAGVTLAMCLFANAAEQPAKPAKAATTPPVAAQEKAPPAETDWSGALPPGRVTVGAHFGDQQAESSGDILVPILSFKNSLVFINPRGTWNDDDGQEFNLGLGYRHLFPKHDIIVGGNAYYDLRNTSLDNTFNQFGAGVEFLSKWVDARANAYLPETGKKTADSYVVAEGTVQEHGSYWDAPTGQGYQITQWGYDITSVYDVKTLQHYQMYEQAMEGFDCEIGALLPIPRVSDYADIKAFVGMYDYNAHYGDDLVGMKGRLEIKPLPSLYLDAAWFEDKALLGSRYSVGVRASLPFDLANLSRGKNPFAGALAGFTPGTKKAEFSSRMTEMVIRDLHIRTDVSEPEEVVADRRQLEKTLLKSDRKDYNLVLASDVTFVDDDNRSGIENGSWEHPYRQINTGVQNAVGTMVYVRDAAQTYYENVVLREGLTLWGSGAPIYGQGNRYLGGIYPVVDGLGRGPAITLANRVTVAGFEITQSALPTIEFTPSAKPGKQSFDLAGIYGENVSDVTILHNYIHGSGFTSAGIQLEAYSISSLRANISDNRIDDVRGDGIAIYGGNISDMDLTLANNTVTRCDWTGLEISANGTHSGDFIVRISGDYSDNYNQGIYLQADGFDMAAALLVDTRANNNGNTGIFVNMWDNELSGVLMASHENLEQIDTFVGTVVNNIPLIPLDPGTDLSVVDMLGVRSLFRDGGSMQANGNGRCGININQNGYANIAALLGVQANDNYGFTSTQQAPTIGSSGGIYISQYGDISVAALIRTEANGNSGAGIRSYSYGNSLALNLFMDVSANGNANCGIRSSTYSDSGLAGAVVLSSEPVLSLIENLSASPLVSEYVNPMDMGFISPYGQVQANNNGGSGIYLDANGHDGAFAVVLDAQASGNGLLPYQSTGASRPSGTDYDFYTPGNGIQIRVNSDDGMALALVSSSEALVTLGSRLLTAADIPIDLSTVRTLGPVEVNNNRNNGIMISATGHDDAIAAVLGVEALWNGFGNITDVATPPGNGIGGDGIYLNVSSQYGDAMAGLAMIYSAANRADGIYANVRSDSFFSEAMLGGIYLTANANGGNGLNLNVQSQSPDSAYLVLGGVHASDNQDSGITAWLEAEGEVMAALTEIEANNNLNNGIYVRAASHSDDNHVWYSDTAIQDMTDYLGGFDLLGLDIIPLLPAGDVNANGNGGSNISIVTPP